MKETTEQRYLGVILDQRLTFKSHVTEVINKAEKRMKILKRLAGTKWGSSKDTLMLTYKTYILPMLMNGSELLICASKSQKKRLEIMQNKALRIITGGIKSTPITSMEMFSDIKPIEFYCDEAALKMYERIRRIPNCLWNNLQPVNNVLRSKVSFYHNIETLHTKYGMNFQSKVRRFTMKKKRRSNEKKFRTAKKAIKHTLAERIVTQHAIEAVNKPWSDVKTIKSTTRKIYVANFRKKTGHDLLYKHLHRIGVKSSPLCPLCSESDQTSEHIVNCKTLSVMKNDLIRRNLDDEELFSEMYWHVRDRQ